MPHQLFLRPVRLCRQLAAVPGLQQRQNGRHAGVGGAAVDDPAENRELATDDAARGRLRRR